MSWLTRTKPRSHIASRFKFSTELPESENTIKSYIQQLYSDGDALKCLKPMRLRAEDEIRQEEVIAALRKLGNKARGLDQLKDTQLKSFIEDEKFTKKVTAEFNNWLRDGRLPKYCTQARMIALSKEDSPFPVYGNIRTLSITPAITKVFEKVIQARFSKQIEDNNLLHPSQRGFRRGMGTLTNLRDLFELSGQIKRECKEETMQKIPINNRPLHCLLFLDLKKAFDRVNKTKLIEKLKRSNVTPDIFNASLGIISNTFMKVEEDFIETRTGVPQGGVLSPLLFDIYINDLLEQLSLKNLKVLAYADDLLIYAKGYEALSSAIQIAEAWSLTNGIEINHQKSAILQVKHHKRKNSKLLGDTFRNIPVLNEYKYLGLVIDDGLKLRIAASLLR